MDINFATVDNDHLLLAILLEVDYLVGLIDTTNQLQSDLVLAVDCEVSQKED